MVADFAFYRKIGRQIWQLSGAFEHNFGLKGREFERNNLQKFKCPGKGCRSFHLIDA